jgi:hypothetical protein
MSEGSHASQYVVYSKLLCLVSRTSSTKSGSTRKQDDDESSAFAAATLLSSTAHKRRAALRVGDLDAAYDALVIEARVCMLRQLFAAAVTALQRAGEGGKKPRRISRLNIRSLATCTNYTSTFSASPTHHCDA